MALAHYHASSAPSLLGCKVRVEDFGLAESPQTGPTVDNAGLHSPIRVYAMLPLDTVNSESVFKAGSAKWFKSALQVLAASGVHGVAVDVWWGAVERSPGVYSWDGYKQLLQQVKEAGLKMQAVLSFHACGDNVGDTAQIQLPSWVLQCGEQDPDLFYMDRPRAGPGQRNKEYISVWASDERVLCGRSAYECYEDFMNAFREAFAEDLGSTIEEVVIGAGPCGELRYPSYPERNGWRFPGIGEFQCYDRRSLASLAAAAQNAGRPEWGYGGPHDAGHYNSTPEDTGFFSFSGSWDTAYGRFFLSWYSNCLLQHGERLLTIANRAFAVKGVKPDTRSGTQHGSEAAQAALQVPLAAAANSSPAADGSAQVPLPVLNGTQPQGQVAQPSQPAQPTQQLQPQQVPLVLHPPLPVAAAPAATAATPAAAAADNCAVIHAGSPTAVRQLPSSCSTISSQGSVQSTTNLCDSLNSTTPTSSCTAALGTEPGLTSSSSSTYLCEGGVDVVGVVRGGQGDKDGPPNQSADPSPQGAPPAQPPQSAAVQPEAWLGSAPAAAAAGALPTPSPLTLPPPARVTQGSGGVGGSGTSPSILPQQPAHYAPASLGSPGGFSCPSLSVANHGSSNGLLSPSAQATACIIGPPSMTLVASGTASQTPTGQAVSLCGSESALSSMANGSHAHAFGFAGPYRASPRQRFSDATGLLGMPTHEAQMALLAQLQESGRVSAAGAKTQSAGAMKAQLPRFMSCQSIAAAAAAGEGDLLARRPLGSGPSLATLATLEERQDSIRATGGPDTPSQPQQQQPAAAAGPSWHANGTSLPQQQPTTHSPTGHPAPTPLQPSMQAPTSDAAQANAAQGCRGPGAAAAAVAAAVIEPPPRPSSTLSTSSRAKLPSHVIHNRLPVTLSLKIPGVHWWFRSRSHAAELTAGYYNTATRDGYAPVVQMCARYGAALTLTCVEMCDGQHPASASCSPEGLLKQVRALTARHSVPLSGENALPIFLPKGVDTVAMERIVINTRAWYGPRAFSAAARQHAYLLALQQQQQQAPLPSTSPPPPYGVADASVAQDGSVHNGSVHNGSVHGRMAMMSCLPQCSYPPYTGGTRWGEGSATLSHSNSSSSAQQQGFWSLQAYGSGGGVSGSNLASCGCVAGAPHECGMGRSVSDAGQQWLQYQQASAAAAGAAMGRATPVQWSADGGPMSLPPYGSADAAAYGGGYSTYVAQAYAGGISRAATPAAGPRSAAEPWSAPQIADFSDAAAATHAAGPGGALTSANRTMSVGGTPGSLTLDLPGEQRGVAACGLRTDSYADITEPLPAMRSFTFLRLGPELLLAPYQAPWIRFMSGMQQGGYAPC